jgi:pimeloyl-ACP methyl ester carboxylesterase
VSRGLKIVLAVLVGLVLLLLLNAVAVSNETKDAEVTVDGAELVETNYGTLQLLESGSPQGTPIVLIHGYAGSIHWFDKLAPLLEKDHRVIRIELLGHGGSEKPGSGERYSIESQASAIAEALAAKSVQGATVVGHSLGVTVATELAARSPVIVSRLVDIDQAPDNSFGELDFTARLAYVPVIGQAMARATELAPDDVVTDEFQQAFASDFDISDGFENPDQPADDLQEMTYTAFDEVSDAEDDYSGEKQLDDRLTEIGVPLLVIFGDQEQIYEDWEDAVEEFRKVPGAQVEVMEGVGHSPQVEKPEEVARLITAFAAGRKPPAPEKKKAAKKPAE